MVSHGDIRLSLYAPCRVYGGTYEPSRVGGGKASHTGGPPVTGFAPPRDHGAAVEALPRERPGLPPAKGVIEPS